MSWFNSLVRRFYGRDPLKNARRTPRVNVEPLESRQLLTVALTGVEMLGSLRSVNAIVLSFNAALDPISAEDVNAYAFGKRDPQPAQDPGFDIGSLFSPFIAQRGKVAKPKLVKNGKIQFASAVYDDTAHTVTLTPFAPFRAPAFFKFLRVRSTGIHTLRDASGQPFNGGVDIGENWKLRAGKVIRYADPFNNHIVLKLHGPGQLWVFFRRGNNADPIIFINNAKAATSVIGTVNFSQQAIAPVNIGELQGASGINTNLLTNPDFSVDATQ